MFTRHSVGANCVRSRAFTERPYEITDTLTNFGRDFRTFQDALSKDGNRKDNLGELLNQKMSDPQNEIKSDNESEDE